MARIFEIDNPGMSFRGTARDHPFSTCTSYNQFDQYDLMTPTLMYAHVRI